jgi:cobalt-precorrin-6B (C15)-methyltransferase
MWQHCTPGIPDELFERIEDVPITKEEIRVIQLSKARLSRGQVIYDIGCGSGSISIEASYQVGSSGKIFSIDLDPNAVELTKKNLNKFQIINTSVILGNALQKITELPFADAIFIGGTGGETAEIIKLCESKLKQGGRLVIATILIETLYSVLSVMEKSNFSSIDITQITISKSKRTATGTMMLARNPVTIISASKI